VLVTDRASARPWRRALRRWAGVGALALSTTALAGCGDATGIDSGRLVGDWTATTFRLSDATGSEDVLRSGGYIDLRLFNDGTTTGEVFVPGDRAANDFFERLDGTWRRSGNGVVFDHRADTFLRDMRFELRRDELVGDEVFDGARITVVLSPR
jgi:hypothetical protein